jgi:hypothetical protein
MIVQVKPGVYFARVAPAGVRLLGALERTARRLQLPLLITCACEQHPPDDPHSKGEAYDVRSWSFTPAQKDAVLRQVLLELSDGETDAPTVTGIGLATARFYGQLEHPGHPKEHFHFQRRKGTVYPS